MLAHKAEDEGIITVEGICGGNFENNFELHKYLKTILTSNKLKKNIFRCCTHRLQLCTKCSLHSSRSWLGRQNRGRSEKRRYRVQSR